MKLIHCSYHKCLTVYYARVMKSLYNNFITGKKYEHFNSWIDRYYAESDRYRVSSINNHAITLPNDTDYRITRFIRDPRDMVVSGYFYHRRGGEPWCNIVDLPPEDWTGVNAHFPEKMGKGHSYASYLQSLNEEDGLIAEIEFRKHHFESMRQWPMDNPKIKIYRYEDILGREVETFRDIFDFYELSALEKWAGCYLAEKFSAKKKSKKSGHIRNPSAGQWKKHFTPKVEDYFYQHYGDIITEYGYEEPRVKAVVNS